jgi:hypothetical protein
VPDLPGKSRTVPGKTDTKQRVLKTKTIRLLASLIVVIFIGIGSRLLHTGYSFLDKYLGDALYAVMFYLLLGLLWLGGKPIFKAFIVMGLMTVIEVFQLTQIPMLLSRSSNILFRMVALLLGTKFEWLDLASYLIGIILIFLLDQFGFTECRTPPA